MRIVGYYQTKKTKIKTDLLHSFCNTYDLYRNDFHVKEPRLVDKFRSYAKHVSFSLRQSIFAIVIKRKSRFISRSSSVFVRMTRENLIRMFSNNRKDA